MTDCGGKDEIELYFPLPIWWSGRMMKGQVLHRVVFDGVCHAGLSGRASGRLDDPDGCDFEDERTGTCSNAIRDKSVCESRSASAAGYLQR
jgi:hypothetical protein